MNNALDTKTKEKTQLINDIANFLKEAFFDGKPKNINKKVTSNKTKHLLIESKLKNLQDKMKKLQTYDSCFFIG